MDYKLEHHLGHNHQEDPQNLGLQSGDYLQTDLVKGQDDQQGHEKKSVLKKVKAKAKKLKDTIKKHGHGHEPEQLQNHQYVGHDDDVMEFDEGEDEDEEMVQDPEVHGAPIVYESTAVRNAADISSSRPKGNLGEPDEGGRASQLQSTADLLPVEEVKKDKTESSSPLSHAVLEQDLEVDPHAPKDASHGAQPQPGNYESKVTDPSGQNCGEACGTTSSVVQSLDQISVYDTKSAAAAAQSTLPTSTGSHDQFSPELSRPSATVITESNEYPAEENQGGGGYAGKLSMVTSALAGTAISAKNSVAAKLGYGEQQHNSEEEISSGKKRNNNLKAEIDESSGKVSSVTAAVADKAINAKNVVASKLLGYNKEAGIEEKSKEMGPNNNINTGTGSWGEKLKPGEEDKVLSEMISDVLHISKKEEAEVMEEEPPPAAAASAANNKSVKERVSDGLHKRDEEGVGNEKKPVALGKVIESEQVVRQLGTEEEKSEDQANAEKTVADTIKGAVSSWWSGGGAGGKSPAAATTTTITTDDEEVEQRGSDMMMAQGRKLGESGN